MPTSKELFEGTKELFKGTPGILGGLSNEEELVRKCPEKFWQDNPWSRYALWVFARGANIKNWEYRAEEEKVRKRQLGCFKGVLGTFNLSQEAKLAVAGWMLSEMLEEVPEYIPPAKQDEP